jgi:hypothetical protein
VPTKDVVTPEKVTEGLPTAVLLFDSNTELEPLVTVTVIAAVGVVARLTLIDPCMYWPTVALLTEMAPPTFTVAVAVVMPGEAALMVTVPAAAPVIGMATEVAPAAIMAVPDTGTVATALLLELRAKVIPPAGAGAEMVRFRLVGVFRGSERVFGLKAAVTVTLAVTTSGAYPVAVAVIWVDPMVPPVTCGFAVRTVRPAEIKTLAGTTVASDVGAGAPAAVAKLIVTPPAGAAVPRLSGRLTIWPGARVGIVPRLISEAVDVTDAVSLM